MVLSQGTAAAFLQGSHVTANGGCGIDAHHDTNTLHASKCVIRNNRRNNLDLGEGTDAELEACAM